MHRKSKYAVWCRGKNFMSFEKEANWVQILTIYNVCDFQQVASLQWVSGYSFVKG